MKILLKNGGPNPTREATIAKTPMGKLAFSTLYSNTRILYAQPTVESATVDHLLLFDTNNYNIFDMKKILV